MPEFGVGEFEPAFENAVFSLKKDGELSKPIETSFGYHLVKRDSHIPVCKNPHPLQNPNSGCRYKMIAAPTLPEFLSKNSSPKLLYQKTYV